MNPKAEELVRDPLFQVNALLWLAQPLPDEKVFREFGVSPLGIHPLLHMRRFAVHAIAPMLLVPLDVRLAAQNAGIPIQEGARPDVVLSRERDLKFLLVECKASSFGPGPSKSVEQARALMIAAGPRASEVFAEQVKAALLSYELPDSACAGMMGTLARVAEEMHARGLPAGPLSTLGLRSSETEVSVVIDSELAAFLGVQPGAFKFIALEPGDDPRPLYFIPYDPDAQGSAEETAFCRAVLFRRMHASVVAAIGRAFPPTERIFEHGAVLNDAMFGMYGHWDNKASAKHMRDLFKQFMTAIQQSVNSELTGAIAFEPGRGWKVKIGDEDAHEAIIDALTRFSAETLTAQPKPPIELFDVLEDDEPQAPSSN
ncbi:MAG: hypothetical protein FJ291_27510 [Planctomycetes bacterium]|nr:hypothetical protein [Planctomycetota bacterium]